MYYLNAKELKFFDHFDHFSINSLSKTPGICFHSDPDYFFLKAQFKKRVEDFIPYYIRLNYIAKKLFQMLLNLRKLHQNKSISPVFYGTRTGSPQVTLPKINGKNFNLKDKQFTTFRPQMSLCLFISNKLFSATTKTMRYASKRRKTI